MKIVLLSLFHYDNYAMRLLFAYLRNHNIPVTFVGFKRMKHKVTKTLKNEFMEMHDYLTPASEEDISVLLDELGKLNPALIGIGLQSSQVPIAKQLTRAIKARFKVPIVWGGTHPTVDPENSIKHTDIVCVGEGFDPLLELSQRILEGKPYDDVGNLWINSGGKIIRNKNRPMIKDLDIIPSASYDAKNKIYIDDGKLQPTKNIDYFGYGFTDDPLRSIHQTMTSFGCPMHCSFCLNALVDNHFRRRSVASVINELVDAKKKNPNLKMVFFWDNIFQVNKKWCLEFAEEYRTKVMLGFFTYSHPLFIDEEISRALRKCGWVVTVMGIQSGCCSFRKEIYKRNETNEQILRATRVLDDIRRIRRPTPIFRIYYDFVKDNPLEGQKELKEGFDLILQFPKNFIYQAFNLSFFPNYDITKTYLEKGLITEESVEGNISTSANNWITTFDSQKKYKGFLRMHEYYYLLCSLAQFRMFPNFLIRMIEKKNLFYNRLHLLFWIVRIVRFFDMYFSLSNYIWVFQIFMMISIRAKIKHGSFMRHK